MSAWVVFALGFAWVVLVIWLCEMRRPAKDRIWKWL
jgi:hypothetical protein